MIKGFKCKFCSEFNTDASVIEKHESECVFDPENKSCYSCKHTHQELNMFGPAEWCKKKHDLYQTKCEDFEEDKNE